MFSCHFDTVYANDCGRRTDGIALATMSHFSIASRSKNNPSWQFVPSYTVNFTVAGEFFYIVTRSNKTTVFFDACTYLKERSIISRLQSADWRDMVHGAWSSYRHAAGLKGGAGISADSMKAMGSIDRCGVDASKSSHRNFVMSVFLKQ